ncbi:MAG: DNA helicase PcrA [Anaerolineae bacterium]
MPLTKQQQAVLDHIEGHLLVLAGPGSGKTHTLIEKMFYIFDQQVIPEPYGLLAITFSNAAVNEIKTRLRQKNFRYWDRIQVQTFHGFATYLLRCYGSDVRVPENFTIIEQDAQRKLLDNLLKKHSSSMSCFNFQRYIEGFKRQGIYPDHDDRFQQEGEKRFQRAYADYQKHLIDHNQLDFTDLIHFAIRLLRESSLANQLFTNYFKYIIVDEFQDTDHQQLELIHLLAISAMGSTIVADDDQAIYGFRGGDKRNVQEIQQILGSKLIILDDNFRSPEIIVEAAHSVISLEADRVDKQSNAISSDKGSLYVAEFADEETEALAIAKRVSALQVEKINNLGQIAVITRNRRRSDRIRQTFENGDIPLFDRSELSFSDTWEANIALAILELSCEIDSSDGLYSLMTAIENSGISYQINDQDAIDTACNIRENLRNTTFPDDKSENVEAILEMSGFFQILQMVSANDGDFDRASGNVRSVASDVQKQIEQRGYSLQQTIELLSGKNAVQLITAHGSKGREFDFVFFIGIEDDIIPGWGNLSEEDISDARRIFYVTITRTRKELYISYAKRVSGYTNKQPSRFIADIPKEYVTPISI